MSQFREVDKKKRGVRWTEKDKATALLLFHANPKAYYILSSSFLLLSVSLLRKVMQKVKAYQGFNNKSFKALELKKKLL